MDPPWNSMGALWNLWKYFNTGRFCVSVQDPMRKRFMQTFDRVGNK